MADTLTILGLESSCDDTAAAIVQLGDGPPRVSFDLQELVVTGR